jgi:hypothetical protein
VLEGRRGARALRRSYPSVHRFLPLPKAHAAELLLPLDFPAAACYAIENWTLPGSPLKRLRNSVAAMLLEHATIPDIRPSIAVGALEGRSPFMLAEAEQLGVAADGEWFLTLGQSDDLTRGVFHVFPRGEREPRWVVKFARARAYPDPFDHDQRGFVRAAEAAAVGVADHAPRLLGRFEMDGLHASIETAAVGKRLTHVLRGRGTRTAKLRVVEAIAGWLVELGSRTRTTPEQLAPDLERLRTEVVPRWAAAAIPASLVDELPPVAGVLQHNDPGSWNIVVSGTSFTVVDWESARRNGLPLWDLSYFLGDALTELAGPSRRDRYAASLFRGEEELSEVLFRWLRVGAEAAQVPREAIGRVVTLGWLHHGLSHVAREAEARRRGPTSGHDETFGERMARVWTTEPGLGPRWDAWRA